VKRSVLADEERRRKAAIEKQQQLEAAAGGRVASMSTVSPAAVKSKVSDELSSDNAAKSSGTSSFLDEFI
jgi:hypothetical protein